MNRRILTIITVLLTAGLMLGATSPATAAPKKVTPKVSLKTPKATVDPWSTSTFKGKVNTKKAVGAKVSVQRKTSKGWKDIKKGKVTKKRRYTLRFQTNWKNSLYRVKVHANKKVRTAYSRTVRVKMRRDTSDIEWTVPMVQARVLKDTNAFRVKHGLKPVALDPRMNKVAQDWTVYMSKNKYFDHNPNFAKQILPFGYHYASENIALGFSPDEVVQGWISSPGHRKNMLNPRHTHMGVGYAKNRWYYTQNFAGRFNDYNDDTDDGAESEPAG